MMKTEEGRALSTGASFALKLVHVSVVLPGQSETKETSCVNQSSRSSSKTIASGFDAIGAAVPAPPPLGP
jgi:hypothetical protein